MQATHKLATASSTQSANMHHHVDDFENDSEPPYDPSYDPFLEPAPVFPPDNSCLTDTDISQRALAASGLNVSAPEFVPSFAVRAPPPKSPSTSEQDSVPHPLSPPDAYTPPEPLPKPDVYSNVTDLLLTAPFFSTPAPAQPEHVPTTEQAVHHFDAHFPALHSANPSSAKPPSQIAPATLPDASLAPKALAWSKLQEEEAEKVRAADMQRSLHGLYLDPAFEDLDDEYLDGMLRNEFGMPTGANVTNDVGSVWVMTGQSVGMLYEALRAEAAQQASIRNKYFDRAASAFKKGDGANAKKWSALGKDANERMKDLHRKAANAIFEARNPEGVSDVIDLHGLHVSEAVERLPAALDKAQAGKIRILTGTGHHTKGTGRARLRPAVKKWLQDNGFFFEEVVDANEYVGSFIVDVKT